MVALRHIELDARSLSAETLALEPVTLSVNLGSDQVNVTLDDESSHAAADAIVIPAGEHQLSVTR